MNHLVEEPLAISEAAYAAWLGRTEETLDLATMGSFLRFAALLDHKEWPWRPRVLPPLGHWLLGLPCEVPSGLGGDGHPLKGDFLPPVALPRRMWAGSRIRFLRDVPLNNFVQRRSSISAIRVFGEAPRQRVFVTVRHEIHENAEAAIIEEQDIVYLGANGPGQPKSVHVGQADHVTEILLDSVALFRFSALTNNAHKIHYDKAYARDVEHYPDLVVQGPFVASLLLDHALRFKPDARVLAFDFRARQPAYVDQPLSVCLAKRPGGADLWASGPLGPTMTASVEWR